MARADRRRAQRTRPAAAVAQNRRRDRGHHVLPEASQAREVDVPLPRARLRARFRRLRRRRRRDRLRRLIRDAAGGGGAPSVSEAQKQVLDNPKNAKAFRDLSTAQQAAGDTDGAIDALQSFTRSARRTRTRCASSPALYLRRPRRHRSVRRSSSAARTISRPPPFARRSSGSGTPARTRSDHERRQHHLRPAGHLGGHLGDPVRIRPGRGPVQQDHRGSGRRIRASSSSSPRPHSRRRLQRPPSGRTRRSSARAAGSDRARGTTAAGAAASRVGSIGLIRRR